MKIIPALIAKNQAELNARFEKVEKVSNEFQLDVMDGKFVQNESLMFLFKVPKSKFEAHLMVKDPLNWSRKHWRKVNSVIVHYESVDDLTNVIKFLKSKGKKIGIAINPDTKLAEIDKYLNKVNKILIMTVYPGEYGAKFQRKCLKKIKKLRKKKPQLTIQVDGAVSPKTIKKLKKAGANEFVVGSFLQQSINIRDAVKQLKEKIN